MEIRITHYRDDLAALNPAEYMDPPSFERYRRACDAGGAYFLKAAGGQVVNIRALTLIVQVLRDSNFRPTLNGELASLFVATLTREESERDAAHARLAGLAPYSFQVAGVSWLAPRRAAILADEPGLGKTIQGLCAAPIGPLLVIAPAVAKGVWAREAGRWRLDLKPAILSGRKSWRYPERGEILITNGDILPPVQIVDADGQAHKVDPYGGCPADLTVIVDECHGFKNGKAKRTQSLRKLLKTVRAAGGRVWGLTGTPLLNRPEELASLLTTFGLFQECYGSWTRYLRVMQAKPGFWGGYEWGKPTPEAIQGIQNVMLRRLRADVMPELPTKTYQTIPVDLDKATARLCAEARAALAANGISLEHVLEQTQTLGKAFECIAQARAALATAKLPKALELIEDYEAAGEPLLVFSAHRAPIDALASRKGWATITGDTPAAHRTAIEAAFQAGQLLGLGLTIKAGGVAITLTRAHHALFIDQEWTPALNSQAEDRICRIGQDRGVVIKLLTAPDTIDEDVALLLMGKQKIINQTIDAAARREKGVA